MKDKDARALIGAGALNLAQLAKAIGKHKSHTKRARQLGRIAAIEWAGAFWVTLD